MKYCKRKRAITPSKIIDQRQTSVNDLEI